MKKNQWQITDTNRIYSYGSGYPTMEAAINAASKRPPLRQGRRFLVSDSNGRAFNLSGERVYV